jgi:hypothetical protein
MKNYFRGFLVEHVDRNKNAKAKELGKVAARKTTPPLYVFFQTIKDSLVKVIESEPRMVNMIQGEDWRGPIIAYLHHHYKPDNKTVLLRMQQRARAYEVIGNDLYKTTVTGPLLHYLGKAEGRVIGRNSLRHVWGAYWLQSPSSKSL